jgi:hypothetical protein
MPDYANIYRHTLRASDPTTGQKVSGTLDPNKRYNLDFMSIPVREPTPEQFQMAQQEQMRTEMLQAQQPEMPEWTEFTSIDDMPEQDYELGRLTIKRQYTDDMKIANQYQPGSPEYMTFAQEAAATMQSRMAKLNADRDKSKMAFRQINLNPNLSRDEKLLGKQNYYSDNPVWEAPRVEYPRYKEPKEESAREQLMKQLLTGFGETPTTELPTATTPAGMMVTQDDWAKILTLDQESQDEFDRIVMEGNPEKIKQALARLRGM